MIRELHDNYGEQHDHKSCMDTTKLRLQPVSDASYVTRTSISIDRNLEETLMGQYMSADLRDEVEMKLAKAFELLENPRLNQLATEDFEMVFKSGKYYPLDP